MEKNLNTFIDEEDGIDLDELLDLSKQYSKAQLKKWSQEHKKMREEEEKLFKNSQS